MKILISTLLFFGIFASAMAVEDFNHDDLNISHYNRIDKQRQVKVYQRSSFVLDRFTSSRHPEIKRTISLELGDITRRQVLATISFKRNGDIVKTRSMQKGDVLRFRFQDTIYIVTLEVLVNKVIKNDYALFSIVKSRQIAANLLDVAHF